MKRKSFVLRLLIPLVIMASNSCSREEFGANPYDPDTPVTVSQLPKVLSFDPVQGEPGTEVTIVGVNFATASDVLFGGKSASSFTIVDEGTIVATVSSYGASGAVSVTNHKGTRGLAGFRFIKPAPPVENANLALNCAVSGSAAIAGDVANVTDGDLTTLWQASANADDWVMIDFGKVKKFNKLVMTWDPMAPASQGELQVSDDGETFTTISSWEGWVMEAWTSGPALEDEGIKTINIKNTEARYVRLAHLYNYSNPPYNMTLKEVEIYNEEASGSVNLALNCQAYGSEAVAGDIANVTDGDETTLWQANANADDWVTVDLGDSQSFNRVVLTWDPMAPASQGELQVSDDGETFTTVSSWEGWVMEAWTSGPALEDEGILTLDFDTVKGRYVKIAHLYNYSNPPYNMTLKEFEIYNTPPAENLALNCAATGSEAIAGDVANVTDGDVTTLWQANANSDDWVMVDLGEIKSINSVRLTWDPMAPASEGELAVSSDGETFEKVASWEGWVMEAWTSGPALEDEGLKNIKFKTVQARYVRIEHLYNNSNPPYNMTLKEFEIFNR